jgi:hypothetical protein
MQRLLNGLVELRQVETQGHGKERKYRSVARVQIHVAEKKERSREVRNRLSSLVGTVYGYVNDIRGSLCSRY